MPVAVFCGIEDKLADCEDAQNAVNLIGDDVVQFEQVHAGHKTFLIGKDMSYFTEMAMELIQKYHPVNPGFSATTEQFLQ